MEGAALSDLQCSPHLRASAYPNTIQQGDGRGIIDRDDLMCNLATAAIAGEPGRHLLCSTSASYAANSRIPFGAVDVQNLLDNSVIPRRNDCFGRSSACRPHLQRLPARTNWFRALANISDACPRSAGFDRYRTWPATRFDRQQQQAPAQIQDQRLHGRVFPLHR